MKETPLAEVCNTPQTRTRYNNILDVDFVESMTDGNPAALKLLTKDPARSDYFRIFQENYEAKKPSKMPYSEKPLIPKIMHHIWLGGGEIPPLYQNYLDECKKLHPDWEFRMWTDKDAEELDMIAKDAFNKSRGYVIKADILRYELLHKFGGVYRDVDVKCYKPLDDLNHIYDFYSSLEGPFMHRYPAANLGVIAAAPGHRVLHTLLLNLRDQINIKLKAWDNDPNFVSKVSPHGFAFSYTFVSFIDEVIKHINLDDKIAILPASYFFPMLVKFFSRDRRYTFSLRGIEIKSYFTGLKPETMMLHNTGKREIRGNNFASGIPSAAFLDFDIANAVYLQRRLMLNAMPNIEQKMYSTYRHLYKANNPLTQNWSKVSKIPKVVHFVVFSQEEKAKLEKHLPMWQMLNGMFDFVVWDKQKTSQEILNLQNLQTSENLRFYLGLKIMEKEGGNYAYFDVKPHMPIFELGNKYNFYAGLKPIIERSTQVLLSHNLIGAGQNNPIIKKILAEVDINKLEQLDTILARTVYENAYLYGKNIVMPASYFESFKDVKEGFIDKLIRMAIKRHNLFTEHNPNSIVE